ncbi:MAG: hypothetical protein HC834_05960 [Rhodospirillales bacterium]|nr:hypothetical protein [Rhodospirillales bacterium]
MEKRKNSRRRRKSALHFVSPLSPEECIYRLQRSAHMGVQVDMTAENSDFWRFQARLFRTRRGKSVVTQKAGGELRRWEGTSTLVDCRSTPFTAAGHWITALVILVLMLAAGVLWLRGLSTFAALVALIIPILG